MTVHRAASDHRLMGQLPALITEPLYDWSRDAAVLSARAQELVANDPFATAMVAAKLDGTHGPNGLRMRSLAFTKLGGTVTDAERNLRREIEYAAGNWYTKAADAGGLLNRKEMDRAIDWCATVLGDGFAIRCWNKKRKYANQTTCWRLVRPERVSNPHNQPNTDKLYHGFIFDDEHQITGIWVETTPRTGWGQFNKPTWEKIDWHAEDGTPNVVHRVGYRLPGMVRGITMFAPMLLLAKQMAGVVEAHVVAKRAQACNPVIYYVQDPDAAAAAHAAAYGGDARVAVVGPHTMFNPLTVYYAALDSKVEFTNTNFNGADLKEFLEVGYRLDCGAWQMPVEVVLAKMGDASLSSARAGLDQYDRTCQSWQNDHIENVSIPMDRSYIAERVARKLITVGEAGLDGLCAAKYSRPPKYSTDRLKDANTAKVLIDLGRSKTAVYAEFGWSYEDEVEERIRDELFEKAAREAAGLDPLPTDGDKTQPVADNKPVDDNADTELDPVTDPAHHQEPKPN